MNISIFTVLTLAAKFHQDYSVGSENTCLYREFSSGRGMQGKGLSVFWALNILASNEHASHPLLLSPNKMNNYRVVLTYLVVCVTSYRHYLVSGNM